MPSLLQRVVLLSALRIANFEQAGAGVGLPVHGYLSAVADDRRSRLYLTHKITTKSKMKMLTIPLIFMKLNISTLWYSYKCKSEAK